MGWRIAAEDRLGSSPMAVSTSPLGVAAVIASEEANEASVEQDPCGATRSSLDSAHRVRSAKHPLVDADWTQ
jgi:hypothetical protein